MRKSLFTLVLLCLVVGQPGCIWRGVAAVLQDIHPTFHEGHCTVTYRCSHSAKCCWDCMYSCP